MADRGRPILPRRSDIRKRLQKQFSRPMTGHTPQKLPSFDAISCIIAVHAQLSHARSIIIPPLLTFVKHFFGINNKFPYIISFILRCIFFAFLFSFSIDQIRRAALPCLPFRRRKMPLSYADRGILYTNQRKITLIPRFSPGWPFHKAADSFHTGSFRFSPLRRQAERHSPALFCGCSL